MRDQVRTIVLGVALLFGVAITACAQPTPWPYPTPASFTGFLIADPVEEIALARTAAPPSISGDADVLTLGPDGYRTAIRGHNGFVCLVDRAWSKTFDDPEFWNPKMRAPECVNAAAARSVLPITLDRARWAVTGTPKAEIIARTHTALAAGKMPAPAPGSMVYMMSKRAYLSDGDAPHWHPHIMFYVPLTSAAAWGANLPGSPVIHADDEATGITTFFVLAPKWSDGTPAAMEMR